MSDLLVKQYSPQFRELWDRLGKEDTSHLGPLGLWRAAQEAHATSDFPQLLANTLGKKVVEQYRQWTPKWPAFCGVDSTNKLGVAIPRIFVGAAQTLELKNQGANVKQHNLTDNEYTVTTSTYASAYKFTRECVRNDDLGALMQLPAKMAIAASRTIDYTVGAFIRANAAAYDSVVFFHASAWPTGHANTVVTALTRTLAGAQLVADGCKAILKQKDIDNRQFLGLTPRTLVSSIDLFDVIAPIAQSDVIANTTEASASTVLANPARRFGLSPVQFEYLGDTTDWYIFADPATNPAIVVSFLDGDMAPKVLARKSAYDTPVDAAGYPNGDIEFDMIFDFGVSWGDPRAAYGGIVSGGT